MAWDRYIEKFEKDPFASNSPQRGDEEENGVVKFTLRSERVQEPASSGEIKSHQKNETSSITIQEGSEM